MTARSAAAAAGALLIAASVSAFALAKHPPIAGTNSVAPLAPQVWVTAHQSRCQRVSHVPAGANRLRVLVAAATPRADHLAAAVNTSDRTIARGAVRGPRPGPLMIPLSPRTPAAHPASVCLTNPGPGGILLSGEQKRTPHSGARRMAVSVVFLRPGSASWLARAGTIQGRYANSQGGLIGGWALWFAGICAIASVAAAFWWVAARADRPA